MHIYVHKSCIRSVETVTNLKLKDLYLTAHVTLFMMLECNKYEL